MTNTSEKEYLSILKNIMDNGALIPNRTGIDALTIPHTMFQHDMSTGFPLLTTKKIAFKTMKVELEGFIKGITDKRWYQERGCKIWNEWCNPSKIPEGLSLEKKKEFQKNENDLGPIYGAQWRNFNGVGTSNQWGNPASDQLNSVVETLKKNPQDRRMICSAWNPLVLDKQALPPCHVLWHATVVNDKLSLCWFQRSCDFFLGIPFNAASYGLLLHLLAKEAGLNEGILTGFFSNAHVYVNHLDAVNEQLSRTPFDYPKIETKNFTSIFDWKHEDSKVINYQCHEAIKAPVAI
jgi:thymidylate synthase